MNEREVDVLGVDELGENSFQPIEVDGRKLVVVKFDGQVRVFQGTCTHEEYELDDAELDRGGLVCIMHFSRFDCLSGEVLDGPAERPLQRYPAEVRDGRIVVTLPALT